MEPRIVAVDHRRVIPLRPDAVLVPIQAGRRNLLVAVAELVEGLLADRRARPRPDPLDNIW